MIIQINEKLHDYEEETYFVDSDKLEALAKKHGNPVDKMVLKVAKNKAFNQEVYIDVDSKREAEPESDHWEDPGLTGGARVKLKAGERPDKLVKLTIYFDC